MLYTVPDHPVLCMGKNNLISNREKSLRDSFIYHLKRKEVIVQSVIIFRQFLGCNSVAFSSKFWKGKNSQCRQFHLSALFLKWEYVKVREGKNSKNKKKNHFYDTIKHQPKKKEKKKEEKEKPQGRDQEIN